MAPSGGRLPPKGGDLRSPQHFFQNAIFYKLRSPDFSINCAPSAHKLDHYLKAGCPLACAYGARKRPSHLSPVNMEAPLRLGLPPKGGGPAHWGFARKTAAVKDGGHPASLGSPDASQHPQIESLTSFWRSNTIAIKYITDLSGLSKANPLLASTLAIIFFSNAGVPPLAGFYGKFNIFLAAVEASMFFVATAGAVVSVIGAFYSIRLIKILYFHNMAQRALKRKN